jgi:peptidoglycan/xylan/chitin deacetylase (PgdA/CDA1 family)
MYHRLGNGRLPGRELGEHRYAVAPEIFEAQLDILRESACPVLSVDAIAASDEGRPLPPNAVSITFDDGNASDHSVALGALHRRTLPAAFFVTPAWVGTQGHMAWPEIGELLAAGMTIGAHGLDHTPLATLGEEELRSHLREARRVLEAHLGQAPRWLALPGGSGGRREVRLAREVGFEHVLGSVPRLAPSSPIDPVPRFAVRRGDSLTSFRGLVEQRRTARLRFWLRHQTVLRLRWLLGRRGHARLRSAWAALPRDE